MKINFDKYDGSNTNNIWRVPISNDDETRKYTIVFEMENSNSQKIKKMYLEDLDENMKAFSRGGEAVNATIKQIFDLFEKRAWIMFYGPIYMGLVNRRGWRGVVYL